MFAIGWLLMAVQNYRFKSPNPWDQCRSYNEILQMLIDGVNLMPAPSIAPHQNEKESKEYEEKWNKRIAEAEEEVAKRNKEMQLQQAEFEQHVNAVGAATENQLKRSGKDSGRLSSEGRHESQSNETYPLSIADLSRYCSGVAPICQEYCHLGGELPVFHRYNGIVCFGIYFLIRSLGIPLQMDVSSGGMVDIWSSYAVG